MTLYTRVLSYLRPHLTSLAAAGAATFAFAALDASAYVLLIPFVDALFGVRTTGGGGTDLGGDTDLMSEFLDATVYRVVDVQGDALQAVQGIIVLIVVVFLLKNVFDFARTYLVAWVEQSVTRDLRNEVYDHVLRLDLSFFGRTRVGQITSRLTHDVEQVRRLLTSELAKLLSSGFGFAVTVAFMLLLSWRLTLAAFVVIPATMGVWGPLVKRLRRGDRRVLDLAGDVGAHIQETLSGIRVVKSSSAEDLERWRFRTITSDYHRTFLKAERLRALAGPLTETLATVGTVVILWYGARLVGRELGRYSFRQVIEAEAGSADIGATVQRSDLLGRGDPEWTDTDDGQGSIMMVVATDAPLSPLKLERLAKRAIMGLARTGSFAGNGSGDYVIAFSTAAGVRRLLGEEWDESVEVPNSGLSALFEGTVEATEEAIYNSLLKATTVSGMGRTADAIDIAAVTRVLREYNVVR